jgi:hypothetical protein
MNVSVKPIVQAMLVADHVYSDVATGKKVIAGIFHTIFARRGPPPKPNKEGGAELTIPAGGFQMGSPFAYLSIVNVRGVQKFTLRYVDLASEHVRFQIELETKSTDPIAPVEIVLPLPPLPTDTYGTFALELLWEQESLGAYRIHIAGQPESPNVPETPQEPNPEAN